MGSGIAQAVAQAGYRVRVRDLTTGDLERGRKAIETTLEGAIQRGKLTREKAVEVLSRIHFTTSLDEALAGTRLVIEAVFEEEKVKRPLFEEVVAKVPSDVVVVTNTSSLAVGRLFEGLAAPERFAGLHFFYPAAINRLVEVVGAPGTSAATLEALTRFSYQLRKIPIQVRDSAGFCVNRFFVPFLNEATRLYEEGLADIPTIDRTANELLGTKLGPFALMNATGIPIAFHSLASLERAFGPAYRASTALQRQFEARQPWNLQETRASSGGPSRSEEVRDRFLGLILGISTRLVEEGVATPEETDRGAVVGLRWSRGPFALLNERGLSRALELVESYASRWSGHFPVSEDLRARARRGDPQWPLSQVRIRREGPLAWVELDRPEVLNALNSRLLRELEQKVQQAGEDPEVRVVILRGSSNVFAAGADISEMAGKSTGEGRDFTFLGQRVAWAIQRSFKPVLAMVEGYALGGGLELALAADFILAAEGTVLGLPEVTLGIHPGFGGTQRLVRLVGPARTKLLVTSGTRIRAEEAAQWGLVARVYPPEELLSRTREIALQIAGAAPLAVRWSREIIDLGGDVDLPTALRLEGESASHTFGTQDQKEGMRAFLERRPPKFQGL
jgi:enoyl-CoA hydratase/3-hydroxyacyl-CoA dehydrogenase